MKNTSRQIPSSTTHFTYLYGTILQSVLSLNEVGVRSYRDVPDVTDA